MKRLTFAMTAAAVVMAAAGMAQAADCEVKVGLVMELTGPAGEYGQAGAATPWDNPQTQHRGQIVPGKPYQQGSQFCRPYTHTIYISGQPQTARGTACRQPDGTWHTVG